MAAPLQEVDILLVGKTGNGKSATGNSILQKKAFTSQASMDSVTKTAQFDYSEFEGRALKVVDGPGLGDTGCDVEKGIRLVVEAMSHAIAANPQGYHAILLVLQYGQRFTQEDVDTVLLLKKIFGETFIRNHTILLLTHGDDLSDEMENTADVFKIWCQTQGGSFAKLFQECGKRAVIFDNITRHQKKIIEQNQQLFKIIDNLATHGLRYSNDIFQKARDSREQIMKNPICSLISEEILREFGIITQDLGRINLSNPESEMERLQKLQVRVHHLDDRIKRECKSSNSLSAAQKLLQNIQAPITEQQKAVTEVMKEREKIQELEQRKEWEQKMIEKDEEMRKAMREAEEREQKLKAEIEEREKELKKHSKTVEISYIEVKERQITGFLGDLQDIVTGVFGIIKIVGKLFK